MKYGVYFAYWESEWQGDYIYYCRKAGTLGLDILEVAVDHLLEKSPQELADLKKAVADNGIILTGCTGLSAEHNLASEDDGVRQRGIEYMKRLIESVSLIGSRLLGGIIYAYWPCDYSKPVDKEKARSLSIGSMRELVPAAKDHNVVLALETVNRFEQCIINDAKEAVAYIEEIDSPNVKVLLDSFHMNIEEDSIGDAIRYTGNHLGHFHIGECNRKVPGKGHMPWKEIGQALRDIHYDKGVVMEPFVKMDGKVGRDIKLYRDLSEGADQKKMDIEIREALEFIKSVF